MASLDFLALFPGGNASLSVVASDGSMTTINDLNLDIIGFRCPLLAISFEHGASGIPRASMEAASLDLVVYFLRFLYTDDYVSFDGDRAVPCSLLLHAQLCRMADIFEVPELQALAHMNVIQETEMACSLPSAPLDLSQAIRFIYTYLVDQRPLIDTILHYCVGCFLQHKLGSNESFRQVAFELRPFHQDLCRTSFKRGFQDDGAIDIVRLPVREPTPHSMHEIGKAALGDFLYGLWSGDNPDIPKELNVEKRGKTTPDGEYPLAHRPKVVDDKGFGSSDDEPYGFTLVHLPKRNIHDVFSPFRSAAQASQPEGPSSSIQNNTEKGQQEDLEEWMLTVPMSENTSNLDSDWEMV